MEPLNPDFSMTEPINRRHKKDRYYQILKENVYEFAENTTLNGVKYISEKGTTFLERLFWISTFILSTVLCFMMVYKAYMKFDTGAIAVTLKEHTVSVNEYPFPAVTICPQARIRQDKYNYTKSCLHISNNTDQEDWSAAEYQEFHSTLVFCDPQIQFEHQYAFLNYSVDMNIFFKFAPKYQDIFDTCVWRGNVDCSNKFRPTLTADGVCYTFNNLASDEIFRKSSIDRKHRRYYLNTSTPLKGWSLEDNYYSSDNDTFPRRGRANGHKEDLYLILKEVKDRDFGCEEQTRPGYKVYLHHPAELPQASLHSYAAQPGRTTSFAVKLDILDTAKELSGYAPQVRQCYFPSERYLQLFQKYTSANCHLECLTNYTLQSCGCVSFHMPHNSSTAICKGNQLNCIDNALDAYANEEDLNDSENGRCGCLPECKEVNYDADVVKVSLDLKEFKKKIEQLNKDFEKIEYDNGDADESYETKNVAEANKTIDDSTFDVRTENILETVLDLTEIRIYYRRPRFVAMERSEMIGLSQFLADVGGTLGLFLGFSFLTLAEIFYFFSIKLCCTFRREITKKEKTPTDIEDL